jgi:Flp pilus assembly protein TadG
MFPFVSRHIRRNDRGQAMAEMAVVLPVLLGLIVGIMQLGIVFNNYVTLTDAVRAGARTAAVSRHYSDRESRTKARVRDSAANLDTSSTTLPIDVSSSWKPGEPVTVSAKYEYSISIVGWVVHTGWLSTHSVERVE